MIIPSSTILTTRCLNRVFDNTTATYKYYWFLGILELFVKQGKTRISMREMAISMIANAWYPVNYFRLSFGKSESLYDAILALQKERQIPINISVRELTDWLHQWMDEPSMRKQFQFLQQNVLYDAILALQKERQIPINISVRELTDWLHQWMDEPSMRKQFQFLQQNVPYRFLRPWIDTNDNPEMMARSQTFENGCLYKLEKKEGMLWVEINPAWTTYLKENYDILSAFAYWGLANFLQVRNPNVPSIPTKLIKQEERSPLTEQRKYWNFDILSAFAYWGLANFLQVRNPNVPSIPTKLIKQEERSPLTEQRKYWNFAMNKGLEVKCLYTDVLLEPGHYALDHFMPWSFVSHDLLWNLMPADASVNSSKGNKLPDLDTYLRGLAKNHQSAINIHLAAGRSPKLLEDYLALGHSPQDIAMMDESHLFDCFYHTFMPIHQIALNMGFESWKYKRL